MTEPSTEPQRLDPDPVVLSGARQRVETLAYAVAQARGGMSNPGLLKEAQAAGEDLRWLLQELDKAVASDRQPYPTRDAYESAARALAFYRGKVVRVRELLSPSNPSLGAVDTADVLRVLDQDGLYPPAPDSTTGQEQPAVEVPEQDGPSAPPAFEIYGSQKCHGCGVGPGQDHEDECDHALCAGCGEQWVGGCDCTEDQERISRWHGLSDGFVECRELGWFSHEINADFVIPDLNRLRLATIHGLLEWDSVTERLVPAQGATLEGVAAFEDPQGNTGCWRVITREEVAARLDAIRSSERAARRGDEVEDLEWMLSTPSAEAPTERCPRCDSPRPHLHPAVQHEGEVQICPDPWHQQATPEQPGGEKASEDTAQLAVGDVVTLGGYDGEREDFTVRGVTTNGRYVILTRPFGTPGDMLSTIDRADDDAPSGSPSQDSEVVYTVIDFERQVNGRDNYSGLDYESDEDIARTLAMFESGEAEVSLRTSNWMHLDIRGIRKAAAAS